MTDKSDQSKFANVRAIHFRNAERRIEQGQYVSAEELADLLRKRGKVPPPGLVIEYIAKHLAGEIRKPSGRRKRHEETVARQRMIMRFEYKRLLALFQTGQTLSEPDQELYGEAATKVPANAPPAQRAARLVASIWGHGPESWKDIQNIPPP
ncbi:hypothetical protein [Henriciella sp.]|uniref:hypothetical protein n=1 Tax=Henriciella sp. TaxID=1968823 RepID=UPI0026393F50|nr:hypothetical protein [Henriciella sp.]